MVYLSIADITQAVFFMTPFISNCDIQTGESAFRMCNSAICDALREPPASLTRYIVTMAAGFGIFAANTTFVWTVCVALHICFVAQGMLPTMRDKLFVWYHIAGWGIPAVIAYFSMKYIPSSMVGKSDTPWCYIDDPVSADGRTDKGASMPWRVATVYGPMWLCWALSFLLYVLSMVALTELYREQREMATEEPGGDIPASAHSLRSNASAGLTGSIKRPASLATEVCAAAVILPPPPKTPSHAT